MTPGANAYIAFPSSELASLTCKPLGIQSHTALGNESAPPTFSVLSFIECSFWFSTAYIWVTHWIFCHFWTTHFPPLHLVSHFAAYNLPLPLLPSPYLFLLQSYPSFKTSLHFSSGSCPRFPLGIHNFRSYHPFCFISTFISNLPHTVGFNRDSMCCRAWQMWHKSYLYQLEKNLPELG